MILKLYEFSRKNPVFLPLAEIISWLISLVVIITDNFFVFLRHHITSRRYGEIKHYKNKYKGERCFIIATGPSLTIDDLNLLKDEYTFGMNALIKIYDKTDFRPTFYGIQDNRVYSALKSEILKYYKEYGNVLIANRVCNRNKVPAKWIKYPLLRAYHVYDERFTGKYYAKFSDDCYEKVYSGYNVAYSMIQIAVYMGFNKIYLVGADCSFTNDKHDHFIEHGVKDEDISTRGDKNMAAYNEANKYALEHDVNIYNATRGGRLEVFPRVNLDDLMKDNVK